MDTIHVRKIPADGRVELSVKDGDFHRELRECQEGRCGDRRIKVSVTEGWPVSKKIKQNTFMP